MPIVAVLENHALASVTLRRKLMEEIRNAGYDLHILTGGGDEFQRATAAGFRMHDIGTSSENPLDVANYIRKLTRTLRSIAPDVCLTYTIRPAIYGNWACALLRIPTITNITGIGPLFDSKAMAYRIARTLYRGAMRHPTTIFFQNDDDRTIFVSKGIAAAKRSKCIPGSGIDFERYSPRPAPCREQLTTFLFIGRLIKDKGITEYVAAAKLLRRSQPALRFQVLGPLWTQNLRSNTITEHELRAWQAQEIIEYLGETDDVREYIAAADCVVLPSYREGTSNVLLEASSMAKPVIASNVTGCKEIVDDGKTGLLCAPRDPESLASAMGVMARMNTEERTVMGAAGREKVIREFDKQIVIDAYLNAIADAIA